MRAIVYDQPGAEDVLRVGEVAPPRIGDGDLRIRVRATAVNRADLLQRQGLYPPPPGASTILGLECAGDVIEVGRRVEGWAVGDRAMALLAGGGYAEEVVVDAGAAMRVPAGLSDEEAGALPEVFLTAFLNIFLLGEPPAGGSILVHGGGSGVGTAAIALCREAGLRIFVTAGSEEKCARCLALGAEAAINYRTASFSDAVRERTGGAGVNVVLDSIGARYLAGNLAALAVGGRLVIIGLIGGSKSEVELATVMIKRLHVVGSTLRVRPNAEKAEIVRRFLDRFSAALAAGRLRPVLDRVLPLDQAAEAHRIVQASTHFGKVGLRVSR
jgi:tumor protein p53-inducible protein 3